MWYNGAPLYYPDSLGYIFWGWQGLVPPERVGVYGLMAHLLSAGVWLRIPLFIQALSIAVLLRLSLVSLFQVQHLAFRIIVVMVLSLGTSLSWTASMLMPDLYTVVAVWGLFLLILLWHSMNNAMRIGIVILILVASMQHASIFLVNGLFIAGYGLYVALSGNFRHRWQGLLISVLVWLSAQAGIGGIHYLATGQYYLSRSSQAFIMGRLAETGILSTYLNEQCAKTNHPLCAYKSHFPVSAEQFLWHADSPLGKIGGLHDSAAIMSNTIKTILMQPKYAAMFVLQGMKAGAQQLFMFEIGDGLKANKVEQLKLVSTIAHTEAVTSRQYKGIPFEAFRVWHYLVLGLSIALFLYLHPISKISKPAWEAATAICIILLANAFVNGAFSTPLHRYQAKVIWLVVFWTLSVLYPLWAQSTENNKSSYNT